MYVIREIMEIRDIIDELKRLPFTKSWQNQHVADEHSILDINTGDVAVKSLKDFIFLPAPSALRHFSNDRKFLAFRNDQKGNGVMDFKLLNDATDNENYRIVLLYVAIMLAEMKIFFMIGNKYGIYIEINELHKKADEQDGLYKELYRHFSVPKTIAHKNGIVEAFS